MPDQKKTRQVPKADFAKEIVEQFSSLVARLPGSKKTREDLIAGFKDGVSSTLRHLPKDYVFTITEE